MNAEPDEFLRRLPIGLELQERILLETIANCLDAITLAMTRIRLNSKKLAELACVEPRNLSEVPSELRTALFSDTWSMVDSSYALLQVLKRLKLSGYEAAHEFQKLGDTISGLRNKMDHLASNAKNLADGQKFTTPLLGELSFCFFKGSKVDARSLSFSVINILSGSLTKPKHTSTMLTPLGRTIKYEVDLFQFQAFGYSLDLSDLFEKSLGLRTELNTKGADEVKGKIVAACEAAGMIVEDNLKHAPADLLLVVDLEAGN